MAHLRAAACRREGATRERRPTSSCSSSREPQSLPVASVHGRTTHTANLGAGLRIQGHSGAAVENRSGAEDSRFRSPHGGAGDFRYRQRGTTEIGRRSIVMPLSSYAFSALREGELTLYRGSGEGLDPILLVAPVAEQPRLESLKRLEREYALRAELDPDWSARPLALTRRHNRMVLVLED